jgi:DNA primase
LAALIPEEVIRNIQYSADIAEIVSETVVLKKAGQNLVGLCPFHTEKTPSFTVSPTKQIFYCFGCGTGGNVFVFLMKRDGISFPAAVQLLGQRYNISIPTAEMTPGQKQRLREVEKLNHVNLVAAKYYRRILFDGNASGNGLNYLLKRKIEEKIIKSFGLGFAPDGWDKLVRFFKSSQIHVHDAAQAGLVIKKKDGSGYIDRFRKRIIFPIINTGGNVVGFGGRVLDASLPKYLNSPETRVFNKRKTLFGLYQAKRHCRRLRTAIVVEGYFDVLMLHQYGFRNAVATLGTALTQEHVRLLKGNVDQIVVVFDSDAAGIKAAERSLNLFFAADVNARILVLPRDQDPDSFLRHNGSQAFQKAIDNAEGMLSFLTQRAAERHGTDTAGKVRVIGDMAHLLRSIDDVVVRSVAVKNVAEKLDIEESLLLKKMDSLPRPNDHAAVRATQTTMGTETGRKASFDYEDEGRRFRFEKQIVAMMMQFPEAIAIIQERDLLKSFQSDRMREIAAKIMVLAADANIHDSEEMIAAIMNTADSSNLQRFLASLSIDVQDWNRRGSLNLIQQFELHYKNHDNRLISQIKAAEASEDNQLLQQLQEQLLLKARRAQSKRQDR